MRARHVFTAISTIVLANAALAQNRTVFVTPIANAPFMAVVIEQRTSREPDGTSVQLKSLHAIARSGAGVIYNEDRPMVPTDYPADPPVTVSHIYDPQTRLNTYLYLEQKQYEQRRLGRPPATNPPAPYGAPEASISPTSQFTQEKDLGNKTMEGLLVHGVLITQRLPSTQQGVQDVEISDEYWFSPDLRLHMLIKHNDPRSGSATVTVTQLSRTEPDEAIFKIPAGFQPLNDGTSGAR